MTDLGALHAELLVAQDGSPTLDRKVFLALGGRLRKYQFSTQSGETRAEPIWPGGPSMSLASLAFTRSLDCCAWRLADMNLSWTLHTQPDRNIAIVWAPEISFPSEGATPALALCAAWIGLLTKLPPQEN